MSLFNIHNPPSPILWIDDDEDELYLVQRILHKAWPQCQIHVFQNLQALLDAYQDRNLHPQLLVTDLNMPETSGIEIIQTLQNRLLQDQTLVRIMTALLPDDEATLTSIGKIPIQYLEKPASPKDLPNLILESLCP